MLQFRIQFIFIFVLLLFSVEGMATVINVPDDATTIQAGISQAQNGDTVLVKPGEYLEIIDFLGKRITVASHFILNGDPKYIRETIINGDRRNTVVRFVRRETGQSVLSGFTITNGQGYGGGIYVYYNSAPTLENLIISGNRSTSNGGGIHIYYYASPTIYNVIVKDNRARYGAGIYSYYSTPVLKNVTIIKNEADYYGGGFCNYYSSNSVMENVTIADNRANYTGGGIYNYSRYSTTTSVVANSIIWNNVPQDIYGSSSYLSVSYSNIKGGWPGNGNFSADPEFADIANDYYNIKTTSPCIDHGNPGAAFNDGYLPPGQGSVRNDMGATGGPGNRDYFSYLGISADFAATDTIVSPGDTCRFNDMSSGYIINWEWDFDNDGTIDEQQQNSAWAYDEMGLFSVKLIASNEFESDTLIKENYIGVIDEAAIIDTVADFPEDQGGYVSIMFIGSAYDCCFDLHNITKYSIWRKMDLNAFTKKAAINFSTTPTTDFLVTNSEYWEYIGEFEAAGFVNYAYTAPTIGTYSAGWWKSNKKYWNTYLVIAHTDNPNIYYKSKPDSGYSIDNIPCGFPKGMQANATEDGYIELNWEEATEKDFNFFRLERSNTPQFAADETDIITETRENTVMDTKAEIGVDYYYRATAVDSNYNESDYSEIVKAVITIEGTSLVPETYALRQNFPNPFNPTTEIRYDLPEETYTKISIYNIAGQLIDVILDEKMPAGYHSIKVNAHHYVSGMYIYRISTPGFTASKKFLLLK